MRTRFQKSLIHFLTRPIQFGIKWYLSRPRNFTYQGITITVFPGVFHPGFFYSTKILLEFIEQQNVHEKEFLELGCGSGIISILAAKKGAFVTACDISKKAVENTLLNATKNNVNIVTAHSDLFEQLPNKKWDWIIINPPYYPSDPKNEAEYAWYCGQEYQYFEKLFHTLPDNIHAETHILMILSEVCALEKIVAIARGYNFGFEKIDEKNVWVDGKNFLYWLKNVPTR
jgi:release factor glutamine methyltransferase